LGFKLNVKSPLENLFLSTYLPNPLAHITFRPTLNRSPAPTYQTAPATYMWGPPVSPFSPSLFLSVFLPVTHRVGAGELAPAPPWPPPPPRCCPAMPATHSRNRPPPSISRPPNPSRPPIRLQAPSISLSATTLGNFPPNPPSLRPNERRGRR
jgi:hypothetical protein